MKRLMTTALVLSMLGGAAQAGSAGLIVAQREQQARQDGPRGDRGGRGARPDAGQPRQERGDRGNGGGDRGQRPDGQGGRPAQTAPQSQPAPQAQPAPQPQPAPMTRGDRGQRPDANGGQRPSQTAPQPGAGQRDGRDNRGGNRGGWDRPCQDNRPGQGNRPGQDNRGGRDNDRDRGDRDRGGWDNRGHDNRGPDRGHQGGPSRDRDHGRDRYDQRRWRPSYHAHQRYRAPAYRYPRGFYVRHWSFGDYLPGGWFGQSYYLDAFQYGLPMPPAGCEWVRVGDDALLIDVWSGRVLSVYYDLFW